jgi:outer membrane biosynthesis protein TonB
MTSAHRSTDRTSKLSASTLEKISCGYAQVHGVEMSDTDLVSMDLSDAKIYIAASKQPRPPVQNQLHNSNEPKPKQKSSGKGLAIVGLILLAIFAIGNTARPETKMITPAKSTVTESSQNEPPVDTIPAQQPMVQPAPVPPPVVQPTPPQVAPVTTPQPAADTSNCDPNYSGACVPISTDVDCAGGSGNGPAYVRGPVRVIGSDIYGLDRDGDGYGCE